MNENLIVSTTPEQLTEGLFGQIFLHVFEVLPYLDNKGIKPIWAIRSTKYGSAPDYVVIPGLLELNYEPASTDAKPINLGDLRSKQVVVLGSDWDYVSKLWHKYFRWPERVIQRANQFPSLGRALGIHYRGTDKNLDSHQTNPVSQEDFLHLLRDFLATHPDIDTIFVASDEATFSAKVEAEYKNLQVLNSGKVTFWKDATDEGGYAKGDHALLDCLLLSRCKYLLKCQSALSGFAKVLNPQIEAYRVSANKLAHWAYGMPYFPDGFIPRLTSKNVECQKILARIFADDWRDDPISSKKYGGIFKYKPRKGYMRKDQGFSRWSFDGLHCRFDKLVLRIRRRLNF